MSDKYAALRAAAEKATWGAWTAYQPHKGARGHEVKVGVKAIAQHCLKNDAGYIALANPKLVLELLAERDADRARIAELAESHSKLRDTMATIHNTIRMDGGYTPLAVILNASKRAHEESAAAAAGLSLKIEGE